MDIDTEVFRQALRKVIDPEIGVNIVDLGLVYSLQYQPNNDSNTLLAEITMTSPACPMGELIVEEAEEALRACAPPNTRVEIQLVWSPVWTPEMMSERAKQTLGW